MPEERKGLAALQVNKVLSLPPYLQEEGDAQEVAGYVFTEDYLIVYVDIQLNAIYLINIDSAPRFPICLDYTQICSAIEMGLLEVIGMDWTSQVIVPFDDLSEKKQAKARERLDVIAPLIEDLPATLRNAYGDKLFQRTIEKSGKSKQFVYDCFNGYLFYGQRKAALSLPIGKNIHHVPKSERNVRVKLGRSNEGIPQGKILDEDDIKAFQYGKRLYQKRNGPSIKATYLKILERFYRASRVRSPKTNGEKSYKVVLVAPTERPTENQFSYWLRKEFGGNLPRREKSRLNPIEFKKDLAGRTGNAHADIIAFGQVFELDETPFDEELVSAFDPTRRTKIGKATLYFVIDRFSKYIVGFFITTENPSYKTVRQALFHAFKDKTAFLEDLGLDPEVINWKYHGVPNCLFVDNAEFRNRISEGAVDDLQTVIKFARRGRGDDKPNVEQLFNVFRRWFKGLSKGFQSKSLADIAAQLARKNASLTIRELNIIAAVYTNYHNNFRQIKEFSFDRSLLEDEVDPIPSRLCEWGDRYRAGQTLHYSDEELYLKLLPQDDVSIHQKGIYFSKFGLWYNCEYLLAKGYQDRKTNKNKVEKMRCRYNENFVDFIFIDTDDGLKIATLDNKDGAYAGLSSYEVKLQKEALKQRSQELQEDELGYQVGLYELMGDIFKNAQKEKQPGPVPQLSTIKDNRRLEAIINRFSDVNQLLQSYQSQCIEHSLTDTTKSEELHLAHNEFDEDED